MFFSWTFAVQLLEALHIRRRDIAPITDQYAFHSMDTPAITFSKTWDLLGLFQIGTREAAWGADPLEFYGGFPNLKPNTTAKFKSSLAPNATVTWSTTSTKSVQTTNSSGAKTSLSVNFTNIDWTFLQTVYGWSALQYQAWARGEIFVNAEKEQTVNLYTDRVIEFAVDGKRYFGGDFYGFRKAPLVLWLSPGRHVIDVRLVRDVRSMGGIGVPSIDVDLEVKIVSSGLEVTSDKVLVSDVVGNRLASPSGSVSVRNNGKDWVEVFGTSDPSMDGDGSVRVNLDSQRPKTVAPGQTRPIVFKMATSGLNATGPIPDTPVTLYYRSKGTNQSQTLTFPLSLQRKSTYEPHRVTHKHPGGIVSYAILRPPSTNATCKGDSAPVFLQFHGAGVEADNGIVAHSLDPLPDLCAWVLYPTGVTPWSSDDWHNWGFADVEAAIASIPEWITATGWKGIGVDTDKWFISGHSNGGQGSWYALTHRPDKIFAAAPVSGYLSIQQYVPYQFWRTMDPRRRAIIEGAGNSYRHELLSANAKRIPIYQQHGGADDNVPTYHSRLMNQLLFEAGTSAEFSELPGKGHWWEGVMTTEGLSRFYQEQLKNSKVEPENLTEFEIAVGNPGDMGSKSGVQVLYLEDPGLIGRVRVSVNGSFAVLKTANVLAFEIDNAKRGLKNAKVDGQEVKIDSAGQVQFFKDEKGHWTSGSPPSNLRHRNQLGGADAILRSNGSFRITYDSPEIYHIALQISRNLQNYFYADAEITEITSILDDSFPGNVIRVTLAESVPDPVGDYPSFPIRISKSRVLVRRQGNLETHGSNDDDVGALFVRPLGEKSTELVVWGRSLKGLEQAARLTPLTTGMGVPDFVLLDGRSRWMGAEGTSLGFFDANWNITPSSVMGWSGEPSM
ncbi:hypothetical protein EJ08DRAFT_689074 [Tothia fuscella]|uniref:Peptidase S9 prolyl oligopeptidase catalytic domain-containing protein n=1 Tax=Tothia fuscella TaxID=1048955 RepID=A0A9P4NLC9_9PEZI|nr:hypothetical protein EJ08DRAFT_689074 [Tothia fuscella]